MRKLFVVPISLVLLLCVSAFASADDSTSTDTSTVGSEGNGFHIPYFSGIMDKIKSIMQAHGLTESNTIGDLLSAMQADKGQHLQDEMAKYGVSTVQDLITAKQAERLDKAKEFLGLDSSATNEEVKAAMLAWKESHPGVTPFGGHDHFRGAGHS